VTATVLALAPPIARPLAVGDRFELTEEARAKLLPRDKTAGVIVADACDCWRCQFDGQAFRRTVLKRFIQAERRR
jgi:hypothetical protein